MDISQIEMVAKERIADLDHVQEPLEFLGLVRQICGLTQDANLSIARTFQPDPDEIGQAKALFGYAADAIASRQMALVLPDDIRHQIERLKNIILERIKDLESTSQASASNARTFGKVF